MRLNILNTKLLNQTWGLNLRDMFISAEAAKINMAKKEVCTFVIYIALRLYQVF